MIEKLLTLGVGMAFLATAATAETLWTVEGFDMPESAIVDTARDRIIVSVIEGHPGDVDGNGRLVLVSRDGVVTNASWTVGLNAPKGMAILGDTLLVADLTQLLEVDLETGEIIRTHDAPGAVFLNDITGQAGEAYISDLMTDTLLHYADGDLSNWLQDPQLSHPNGVLLDGDRLLVGSWGAGMNDDFSTQVPGSLLEVSLETMEIAVVASALGNLDGIARIAGTVYVSDWVTGDLLTIAEDGTVSSVSTYGTGIADISAEGSTLFIPMMLDGTLIAERIE